MKPTIFLDMDGVIADWMTPALAAVGRPGEIITGWDTAKQLGMDNNAFWKAQDDRPCFWLDILPYPGAREWVNHLRAIADVYFCTSPSLHNNCASHKITWLRKHMGDWTTGKFFICKAKHLLARDASTILIDDSEANVDAWCKTAPAVLFPRPWNSVGAMTEDDARGYVMACLDHLFEEHA